jgi:hypothetical protein
MLTFITRSLSVQYMHEVLVSHSSHIEGQHLTRYRSLRCLHKLWQFQQHYSCIILVPGRQTNANVHSNVHSYW